MRLEQLTFVRFLAAFAIVVFHFGSGAFPFNNPNIDFIVQNAYLGVSYFFILSGFIMVIAYSPYEKIDTISFLRNRLARIYPLLFLSVVLLFIHTYFFDPAFKIGIIKNAVINLSLLQSWFPEKALLFNGPAWSLSVEFFFYLTFPFLFNKLFSTKSLSVLSVGIIAFWIIFQIAFFFIVNSSFNKGYPSASHALLFYSPLMHFSAFLAGTLGGIFFVRKLAGKTGNYDIPVIFCVIVLLLLLKYPFGANFHNGLLAIVFVPLIIFMSMNKGIITKLFTLLFLVVLGEISFGVYILQVPVFRLTTSIVRQLDITHDSQQLFYISSAVLLLFSYLSYYLFETPIRNIIKSVRIKPLKL